jgi:choline dehydrogenase
MDRRNLTVLTGALVTRIVFDGQRAVGVEFLRGGQCHRMAARCEIVLSLGAVNTPRVLMQSGIGDESGLARASIEVVQHLPGVGRHFTDHVLVPCVWEYQAPLPLRNNGAEATLFWKSDPLLDTPDVQSIVAEGPVFTPETAYFSPPAASCSIFAALVRPRSRGHLRVTGPNLCDPIEIVVDTFSDPADMRAMIRAIGLCPRDREFRRGQSIRQARGHAGQLTGSALKRFVRDATSTFWHYACTAKMVRDEISVVNSRLQVYGIDNLRVADASIMPRVTTGNTMATCVVIGERAAELMRQTHRI